MHNLLFDLGRIGIGMILLLTAFFDYKAKTQIFGLMTQKKLPVPKLLFIGGIVWKILTSLGLIFSLYTYWAALLLAVYIFIANLIFNSFWSVPKEQRDMSLSLFILCLGLCFGLLAIAGAY